MSVGGGEEGVTVLLVDNYPVMRHGLTQILRQMQEVQTIIEADTLCQAVAFAQQYDLRLAFVDLDLPDGSGLEACAQITMASRDTSVLILSDNDWDVSIFNAWEVGASGFINKTTALSQLIPTIRLALQSKIAFTPDQIKRIQTWKHTVERQLQQLTLREKEVLQLLLERNTNQEISLSLGITLKTVECHVRQIMIKLNCSSRREVVRWLNSQNILAEKVVR